MFKMMLSYKPFYQVPAECENLLESVNRNHVQQGGNMALTVQPAFVLLSVVVSIVLQELIYCFTEFSLWENGLKEINSQFDPEVNKLIPTPLSVHV